MPTQHIDHFADRKPCQLGGSTEGNTLLVKQLDRQRHPHAFAEQGFVKRHSDKYRRAVLGDDRQLTVLGPTDQLAGVFTQIADGKGVHVGTPNKICAIKR